MILDTSFLIDIQNSVPEALETVESIEVDERPRRVPHVVVYELYIGVGNGTQTKSTRDRIERVLGGLPQVPTTPSIVRRAGRIEGRLQRDDEGVGAVDAIIGATALEFGEPVVSANVKHFDRMPDVEVTTY